MYNRDLKIKNYAAEQKNSRQIADYYIRVYINRIYYSSLTFFLPHVNIGNKNEITEAPIQKIAACEKS